MGTHFFDVAHGGSTLLWQHLFWFFGHPEVYILIVPAFGIATSIIPTFTQRRMAAFPLVAIAELLVVLIGFGVWAHHMFSTGIPTVTLVFFAAASALVVIPSTIQVFAWCMSMVTGGPRFTTPMLFIAGFIFMFVTGGLTGIMFVAIPFDQQVTDTYFVIAHFHYIIFGAAVFPIFGGIYYWFPKVTGKLYFERPGQISFWILFVGTNLLFFPMHIVGLLGMTRRVYTYPDGLGWRLQPGRDDRRLRHARRDPAARSATSSCSYRRGRGRRPRSVGRADARVVGGVAAARLRLRRHPEGVEPVSELGHGRPRGGPAPARARHPHRRTRARAAGDHPGRRATATGRPPALGLGLADRAGRRRSAVFVLLVLHTSHGGRGGPGAVSLLALAGWHAQEPEGA